MTLAQDWIVLHDAKVLKLADGQEPDPQWLSQIDEQIRYWNIYAKDPCNGYELMTRRLKYVAPKRTVEFALPHFERIAARHLQEGAIDEGRRLPVLELGTGTGLVGARLIRAGFAVDGIDFSREMLRKAAARNYRDLVCADLRQADLGGLFGGRYAAVISVGVYGDFVDARWLVGVLPLLEEHAVLAVSGRVEYLQELQGLLEESGFTIVEARVGFAHYTADFSPKDYLYLVAER